MGLMVGTEHCGRQSTPKGSSLRPALSGSGQERGGRAKFFLFPVNLLPRGFLQTMGRKHLFLQVTNLQEEMGILT